MEAPEGGQSGTVLVLVLIFLIIGAFVIVPLAGLATANLQNTAPYISLRQTEFAADGAMDLAIETVRYSTTQGYPGGSCASITTSLNSQTVTVNCKANAPSASTTGAGESRNVSFWVCPSGDTTTDCPGESYLQATADYSDFTPTGGVEVGYAVRILSWEVPSADS